MDAKKTNSAHHPSSVAHRSLQKSTTLNRKFVKKPTAQPRIIKASEYTAVRTNRRTALAAEMNRKHLLEIQKKSTDPQPEPPAPVVEKQIDLVEDDNEGAVIVKTKPKSKPKASQKPAPEPESTSVQVKISSSKKPSAPPPPPPTPVSVRHASSASTTRPPSASELKDRAIAQALAQAENLDQAQTVIVEEKMEKTVGNKKHFWRRKKFALAFSLSIVSVAFLGFLVYRNLPDIITRVTAASSGIDTGTPAFIPKNYYRDSIVSEKSGKITLSYTHSKTNATFTITEEKSSWNSSALLNNHVTPQWGDDYSIAHEQGLTIYINNGDAAWVNGGIFYLIESSGSLSTSDLHDIAISI